MRPKPPNSLILEGLKPIVRDGLSAACRLMHLSDPAVFARDKLTIVTFHRVLNPEQLAAYPIPAIAVTPAQLEQFLAYFTEAFTCLPLSTALERREQRFRGDKPLLCVTFDDGARDNAAIAAPILDKFKVRATFYIPVDNLRQARAPWPDRAAFALSWLLQGPDGIQRASEILRELDGRLDAPRFRSLPRAVSPIVEGLKCVPPALVEGAVEKLEAAALPRTFPEFAGMMNETQLLELVDKGHEIGSHSLSHPMLPLCDDAQLVVETRRSRELLSEMICRPISSFCYPDGAWDARCVAAVRTAGYNSAVTTDGGLNRASAPAHELRRWDMDFANCVDRRGRFSRDRVAFRLSGLRRFH